MQRVIEEYALEKKKENGDPSGVFVLNKKMAMALGKEVIEKAKGIKDKQLDEYVNQYFARTWEHFDVNETGTLDAIDMQAFCKYLASDQSLDLDELYKVKEPSLF